MKTRFLACLFLLVLCFTLTFVGCSNSAQNDGDTAGGSSQIDYNKASRTYSLLYHSGSILLLTQNQSKNPLILDSGMLDDPNDKTEANTRIVFMYNGDGALTSIAFESVHNEKEIEIVPLTLSEDGGLLQGTDVQITLTSENRVSHMSLLGVSLTLDGEGRVTRLDEETRFWTYTYIDDEILVQGTELSGEDVRMTLNEKGYPAEVLWDENGLHRKYVLTYDEKGNALTFTTHLYKADGSSDGKRVTEYEYDANGKKINTTHSLYDADGNLTWSSKPEGAPPTPQNYTVTYQNTKGAVHNNPSSYTAEDLPITLQDLSVSGCQFLGWYLNGVRVTELSADAVSEKILIARWGYTVTFDSDGGTPINSIIVEEGGTAAAPNVPTKVLDCGQSISFDGWLYNGEAWSFGTPITDNITLQAKWRVRAPSVSHHVEFAYLNSEGEKVVVMTYRTLCGRNVPGLNMGRLEEILSTEGYAFVDWIVPEGYSTITDIPVYNDMTVYFTVCPIEDNEN